MQAGDYGNRQSEPWTYRKRVIPLRTFCGEIKYKRKKNLFKISDAERILAKLQPDPEAKVSTWVDAIKMFLRQTTIMMMDKLLPFLANKDVEDIYDFCIAALDRLFKIPVYDPMTLEKIARRMIIGLADRYGLTVTIKK